MNLIPVYYETGIIEDEFPCIYATYKDYFDKHQCLDDGGSGRYVPLEQAFTACGAPEATDSVFELDGVTVESVVANMRTHGFDLVKSEAFSKFIADTSDDI